MSLAPSSLTPITCPHLCDDKTSITHGFFTRQGGVSKGIYQSLNIGPSSKDLPTNVAANRRAIVQHLGLSDDDLVTPWQYHSDKVAIATSNWGNMRPKADAIVTKTKNLPIAIVTADCGPVLFCDQVAQIIAVAHAGWRGATGGILEATIKVMVEQGATRDNIHATLGPTISQPNYEVGPEFIRDITTINPENEDYLNPSPNNGHALFDLPRYIVERLQQQINAVNWTGHCTYGDEKRFFSYRRMTHKHEPDYGRQISAITLKA